MSPDLGHALELARGEGAAAAPAVYLTGAPDRGVAACASCHGAGGEGLGAGDVAGGLMVAAALVLIRLPNRRAKPIEA